MVSLNDYRNRRTTIAGNIAGVSSRLTLDSYRRKKEDKKKLDELYGEYEPPEEDFTIQKFAQDKNRIATLNDYMNKRLGEDGLQQDDETDEDYVKRFMTHARRFETNSIGIMGQID